MKANTRLRRPVLAMLIALSYSACSTTPPSVDPKPEVAPSCHQPIEKACAGACDPYDIAAATTKATAAKLGQGCVSGGTGTCGNLRFVHLANGFVADTRYFDASGKLVAAVRNTDVIDPQCKGTFTFGIEVSCNREPTEGYCPDFELPSVPSRK
jgi:hypothetical protein